jgi:SET domain-containing protein
VRRTTLLTTEDVQVKHSKAGLGLFAKVRLAPGRYIEYTGPYITNEEADARPHARYFFEVNSKWTIDGNNPDNIARRINHSCKPNCEAEQHGRRIFITVITPIQPGEELGYDYGSEYFDDFIKPDGCKCIHCDKAPRR